MPSNKKLLQAAAGSAGGDKLFPEDVFSTYLYTGTGSSPTITTGIDMLGEGGLVWNKNRTSAIANLLVDSERGVGKYLSSDSVAAQANITGNSFTNTGYVLGTDMGSINNNNYASWSFRKAEGFCDIVTYTGNGSARTIAHNLGSVPKMIIVKSTSDAYNWYVYHASLTNQQNLTLDTSSPAGNSGAEYWNSTTATSSVFSLGTYFGVNGASKTYVAYVFGDDAIFGEGGDEQICKMGSFTGTPSALASVNLGFEPQWIMIKATNASGGNADNWRVYDNMRGWDTTNRQLLVPNETQAESAISNTGSYALIPTATGFDHSGHDFTTPDTEYIYMAIRRPMKVPEAGTEVFAAAQSANNAAWFTSGFPVDLSWVSNPNSGGGIFNVPRITAKKLMYINTGAGEADQSNADFDYMTGAWDGQNNTDYFAWMFKRASQFMDVVAYNGSGSAPQNVTHNLTVTPEMMLVKYREGSTNWYVYHSALGNTKACYLDTDAAPTTSAVFWNNTSPTATQFTLGSFASGSGKYIAYLFATLAGISKVGSVVHSGTTNVDCGFSAGARFVLVKRTDSTGDWYVWDSVRGIVSGNDPYLLLNSSAAQVTNTDYIDPLASGFTLTSSFTAGTYLFLAIA